MLAISPLKGLDGGDGIEKAAEILFEDINFDDLFEGLEDGDILPDLEIDPSDIFADFSFCSGEESLNREKSFEEDMNRREDCKESSREEVEVVSARTKEDVNNKGSNMAVKGSKVSAHGKKKAKVDWTPELHRRFVQAVEQLGVDKAVPSRILELMGIDCLTRHNIASHLQKYRSHRKHLQAKEAEAASWSQRRHMYSTSAAAKMNVNPNWAPPPIIGFPPPMHQPPLVQPLHVWGHPSVEQPQVVPIWPQPTWGPPQPTHGVPPPALSYWHHHHYQRPLTRGTPCFSPLMPAMRFPALPVHGIPPHPVYRSAPPPINKSSFEARLDAQSSNETIDAAIGDVLAKPWLPLPLGLKPPSLDSVMGELQKQGVPKVP